MSTSSTLTKTASAYMRTLHPRRAGHLPNSGWMGHIWEKGGRVGKKNDAVRQRRRLLDPAVEHA